MDLVIVLFFFRFYDFKRSAEKKEHKTIEAADKVKKCKHLSMCKLRIYCSLNVMMRNDCMIISKEHL